jgi:hypothetical protein
MISNYDRRLVHCFQRDVRYLEKAAAWTALIPLKGSVRKDNSADVACRISFPLLVTSIIIILIHGTWSWDNLQLSRFKRNSEKLEYLLFHLAIWMTSAFGRIAFLIVTKFNIRFFYEAKSYVNEFLPSIETPDRNGKAFGKRRRFKVTCLVVLHVIYLALMIELLLKEFGAWGIEQRKQCQRMLVPCNRSTVFSVLSIIFSTLQSAPQYFLTYYVIVMSDFLVQAIESFQHHVLVDTGFKDGNEKLYGKADLIDTKVYPNPTDFLITSPGGKVDIPSTIFTTLRKGIPDTYGKGKDNTKIVYESYPQNRNYHDQFAKLKNLFFLFNASIGLPLITSCFTDVLILICLLFSILPKFSDQTEPNSQVSTE